METIHDVLSLLLSLIAGLGIGFLAFVGAVVFLSGALYGLTLLLAISVGLFKVAHKKFLAHYGSTVQAPHTLTLLIRFDETRGHFHPSAQLRGEGPLGRAWIRLELVDRDGRLRLVRRRRLPHKSIDTELPLVAFEPPDGVSAEEVLGWRWDVVIEDRKGERARWREHPRPAGFMNAEAELS